MVKLEEDPFLLGRWLFRVYVKLREGNRRTNRTVISCSFGWMIYCAASVDRSSLVEQTTPSAVVIIDAARTMGPFFCLFCQCCDVCVQVQRHGTNMNKRDRSETQVFRLCLNKNIFFCLFLFGGCMLTTSGSSGLFAVGDNILKLQELFLCFLGGTFNHLLFSFLGKWSNLT